MPGKHGRPEDRFWRHVAVGDGCWTWTASTRWGGYGQFRVNRDHYARAHVFAWELYNGPVAEGMFVCHHCDNPPCVRPEHLFLGTPRDNTQDMFAKGRAVRHKGVRVAQAKLTAPQVTEIRERYAAGGILMRELAAEYGLHKSNIVRLISNKHYRN